MQAELLKVNYEPLLTYTTKSPQLPETHLPSPHHGAKQRQFISIRNVEKQTTTTIEQ